jgi:hypothetical protein
MGALSAGDQVLVLNRPEFGLKRSEMAVLSIEAASGGPSAESMRDDPNCPLPQRRHGGISPELIP